jgi:hypothetical protein
VRTGFTLAQVTAPMAQWAGKNKIKSVVTFVSDYGPGLDAEKVFVKGFTEAGGKVVDSLRAPRNPDYAPFLARVKDLKPDALFVFVPSGEGAAVLKQFTDRGLAAAGIRLICTGDVLDDDLMASIGPAARVWSAAITTRRRIHRPRTKRTSRRLAKPTKHASELPLGRRLRRHAHAVPGAQADGRRQQRRQAAGGNEGHGMDQRARPGQHRCRHATSCRRSTSARPSQWRGMVQCGVRPGRKGA